MASVLAVPQTTVDQIDRVLAEAGLRRMGGRGNSAARMSFDDAANELIAVAAAPVSGAFVKDAAKNCLNYASLRVSKQDARPWFDGKYPVPQIAALPADHTVGDVLRAILEASASGDLQAAVTKYYGEDTNTRIASIAPRTVEFMFIGPFPQVRVKLGRPGNGEDYGAVEEKIYIEEYDGGTDLGQLTAWNAQMTNKYGEHGDLEQIRIFTVRTILSIGKLFKDET